MKLRCKRCQYGWEYRGRKRPNRMFPVYVCCPRCRIQVKLTIQQRV